MRSILPMMKREERCLLYTDLPYRRIDRILCTNTFFLFKIHKIVGTADKLVNTETLRTFIIISPDTCGNCIIAVSKMKKSAEQFGAFDRDNLIVPICMI